jgi:subtilisin family serine protease
MFGFWLMPRNCGFSPADFSIAFRNFSIHTDDQGNAGDGTPPNDGWSLFSGTSAAAPQIAGAAAVLLSAKPKLTPA